METILKIDNIEKYYGNKSNMTKAIDGISFDVEAGEFVAIMGASGSGKTTLLNCVSTIDKVSTAVDIRSSLSYLKRLGYNCCINNFDRDLSFGGCGNADEGFLYIVADDEELKGMLESQINGTIPTTEEEHQRAVEHYEFFNDPVIHPKVLLEIERRKAQNTEILKSYGLSL